MGIKFCQDMTRPSLQVAEKEYPSLPQDCVFTASSFSQLQKRAVDSNIQEDTNKTLAGFSFLSVLHDFCSSLITTWSSPLLALSLIPAPLYAANSLGISLPKHHASHWMIGKTKQGWLMLLRSQILISRWFVLLSSLVCWDGRGSQKLFLCLEPNKELTRPAERVLWSVRNVRGTIHFMGPWSWLKHDYTASQGLSAEIPQPPVLLRNNYCCRWLQIADGLRFNLIREFQTFWDRRLKLIAPSMTQRE